MTQSNDTQEEVLQHIDNVLWASQVVDGAAALNHAVAHGDYELAHSEWACLMQVMVSSTGSPAKGGRHDRFYCECPIHAKSRDDYEEAALKEDDTNDTE